jgi:hypothetical protein
MTKILCPVCGVMGSVQQRGNSTRIGHYVGFRNGVSIVQWHKIDSSGKDEESLVKNNLKGSVSGEYRQFKTASIQASGAIDAGSNPASPTIRILSFNRN